MKKSIETISAVIGRLRSAACAAAVAAVAAVTAVTAVACTDADSAAGLDIDTDRFDDIPAAGGQLPLHVASQAEWIASSDQTWITISPANGRGPADCRIIVDSALMSTPREGYVVIRHTDQRQATRTITVTQQGFPLEIAAERQQVEIPNYADYGARWFDVKVTSNVDFDVEAGSSWVKLDERHGTSASQGVMGNRIDRGVRPREVTLRFQWDVNSIPDNPRRSEIRFVSRATGAELSRNDMLSVIQEPAEHIDSDTRSGDSTALLGVQRSLGLWHYTWDASQPMSEWYGVQLWEQRDADAGRCKAADVGRVRKAQFYLFQTKEGIPYEVQYLTAAEELYFFSNVNTFLFEDFSPGEYITQLTQLKRLTIGAYGITKLPDSFGNLSNLEYLALDNNNLDRIPQQITPENFPRLRALVLNACQRYLISDLSNSIESDVCGLIEEQDVLTRMFQFEKLDTLVLGINYLHGRLPRFDDRPKWGDNPAEDMADLHEIFGERDVTELLGRLRDRQIPKVMPQLKWMTLLGNRFTGELPDWLLYHPRLDEWLPLQLIFVQEGRTRDGEVAGFTNEPVNLDYYYDFYEGYKERPSEDYLSDEEVAALTGRKR